MTRLRVLVVVWVVLAAACSSGKSDSKAGSPVGSSTTTAPATTSSTAAPAACPKLQPASEPAAPANLADIQMISPTKGFAVGKGLIMGTDDGHTWTPRYTGGAAFGSVDAVDSLHAWAVGDRALYATVDGGRKWVGVGSPDDGTVFRAVHFIDEHFGWGVGRNGKLYRSGDGGHTWGELMPPCGAEKVCFTAQEDGWVAAGDRIARSTNGGDFWTPTFTVPAGEDQVNGWHPLALQCAKGGVVWVLFGGSNAAMSHSPWVLYRGTADGQWTAVAKEGMTAPKEITAPAGGSYPGPLTVLDGGSAALVLFTPPGVPPVSLAMATENGRSLSPGKEIPGIASPLAAAFLSPTAGWVLGTRAGGPPSTDTILATTDGGATWTGQFSHPGPTR